MIYTYVYKWAKKIICVGIVWVYYLISSYIILYHLISSHIISYREISYDEPELQALPKRVNGKKYYMITGEVSNYARWQPIQALMHIISSICKFFYKLFRIKNCRKSPPNRIPISLIHNKLSKKQKTKYENVLFDNDL